MTFEMELFMIVFKVLTIHIFIILVFNLFFSKLTWNKSPDGKATAQSRF